jgi:magnesium-transporting ATPase (P-type)
VLTNESDVDRKVEDDEEVFVHRGDPTETALLEAAWRVGMPPDDLREAAEVLAEVPFESELRYSYTIVDEHGPLLRLKGAPERVLDLCTTMATATARRRSIVRRCWTRPTRWPTRGSGSWRWPSAGSTTHPIRRTSPSRRS